MAAAEDSDDSRSHSGTSSSSDGDDSNAGPPVESLIAGREKRATAGNRLSTLLDREADDDLELLFAEDEEDVEFEGGEDDAQSDVQFDSSDEAEDDQRPPDDEGKEDLEGERELQRQSRAERQAKKRKTQDAFFKPPGLRKKLKIDPTTATEAPTTPAPRPKKKSERVSWIPETGDGPTRSSSRRATIQNKNLVHERLQVSEKRRLHQIAVMEAAAKRKEKSKPKVMTQADRLAEADRTEKLNSKSLNRWEEAEKKRTEEQAAKLAALQNRHLDGPVITWWSGMAEWANGKMRHVGRKVKAVGEKHDTSGKNGADGKDDGGGTDKEEAPAEGVVKTSPEAAATINQSSVEETVPQASSLLAEEGEPQSVSDETDAPSREAALPQSDDAVMTDPPASFLDGIHYYASLPDDAPQVSTAACGPSESAPRVYRDQTESAPQPPSPVVERSSRNLVVLENFDPVAIKDREVQRRILFKQRTSRPHSMYQFLSSIQ